MLVVGGECGDKVGVACVADPIEGYPGRVLEAIGTLGTQERDCISVVRKQGGDRGRGRGTIFLQKIAGGRVEGQTRAGRINDQ